MNRFLTIWNQKKKKWNEKWKFRDSGKKEFSYWVFSKTQTNVRMSVLTNKHQKKLLFMAKIVSDINKLSINTNDDDDECECGFGCDDQLAGIFQLEQFEFLSE